MVSGTYALTVLGEGMWAEISAVLPREGLTKICVVKQSVAAVRESGCGDAGVEEIRFVKSGNGACKKSVRGEYPMVNMTLGELIGAGVGLGLLLGVLVGGCFARKREQEDWAERVHQREEELEMNTI